MILDSAKIKLPTGMTRTPQHRLPLTLVGSLSCAYDELGTRYVVPDFCLSRPSNFVEGKLPISTVVNQGAGAVSAKPAVDHAKSRDPEAGEPLTVKVRLSIGQDLMLEIRTAGTSSSQAVMPYSRCSVAHVWTRRHAWLCKAFDY